jgi:hypothetical protein
LTWLLIKVSHIPGHEHFALTTRNNGVSVHDTYPEAVGAGLTTSAMLTTKGDPWVSNLPMAYGPDENWQADHPEPTREGYCHVYTRDHRGATVSAGLDSYRVMLWTDECRVLRKRKGSVFV